MSVTNATSPDDTPRAGVMPSRSDLVAIAIVIGVAVLLRGAFHFRAPVFLEGDSQSYLLPAWDLLHGAGFAPEIRRAPVYPVFIASTFAFAGAQLETLAAFQHLLGIITVGLTYLLARRWLSALPSAFAAGLVAVSGPIIIYERYVMSETLFGTLLTATILALVVAIQKNDLRWFALGGALMGLTALCRPVSQVMLGLAPLTIVLIMGLNRRTLIASAVSCGVMLAVLAPWALRNLGSHGTMSSAGGLGRSLIARTVKYDEGFFNSERVVRDGEVQGELKPAARQIVYRKRNNVRKGRSVRPVTDAIIEELQLTPGQADTLMRQIALEAIADRPNYYLQGTAGMIGQIFMGRDERLAGHWRQRADKDWEEQWETRIESLVTPVTPIQQMGYPVAEVLVSAFQPARLGFAFPALGLLGAVLAVRNPRTRVVLLPAAVTLTFVSLAAALDGPVPRYRYPVDPLIAVCVASLVPVLATAVARMRRPGRIRHAERQAAG
ncbi:MAG: ArnT family glycosyltransferase [Chloroflexota bacterium]